MLTVLAMLWSCNSTSHIESLLAILLQLCELVRKVNCISTRASVKKLLDHLTPSKQLLRLLPKVSNPIFRAPASNGCTVPVSLLADPADV